MDEIHAAHSWLVNKLNILKSGRDVQGGQSLFEALTTIDDYWASVRDVCLAHKKPRWAYLPALISRDGETYKIEDPSYAPEDETAMCAHIWCNNCIKAGL